MARRSAASRVSAAIASLLIAVALLVAEASAQTQPIHYGYDELGRLVIVVDQTGNAAIYSYDAVGNLLSIVRVDPTQIPDPVAITAFTPTRGKVGTSVSIFGKGFSATASQNSASFNGGAATVTSASANRLIVTVPSSAMTGPISVTSPLGSAVSADSFRLLGALALTPNGATVNAGSTVQFTVAGPGGYTPTVDWAVNGIAGGNAGIGTISATGLYTAPASLPQSIAVKVSVADHDDPTTKTTVPVTVLTTGSMLLTTATDVSVRFPDRLAIIDSVRTSVSASVTLARTEAIATVVSAYVTGAPSATASATPTTGTFEPVIITVSPATIARGANNVEVILTGMGFSSASGVAAILGQSADTNVAVSISSISGDGTQVTLMVTVASTATTGARAMQITTPTGTSTAVNTGSNVLTVQ